MISFFVFPHRWIRYRIPGLLQACRLVLDPGRTCLLCCCPQHDRRLAPSDLQKDKGRGKSEGVCKKHSSWANSIDIIFHLFFDIFKNRCYLRFLIFMFGVDLLYVKCNSGIRYLLNTPMYQVLRLIYNEKKM